MLGRQYGPCVLRMSGDDYLFRHAIPASNPGLAMNRDNGFVFLQPLASRGFPISQGTLGSAPPASVWAATTAAMISAVARTARHPAPGAGPTRSEITRPSWRT